MAAAAIGLATTAYSAHQAKKQAKKAEKATATQRAMLDRQAGLYNQYYAPLEEASIKATTTGDDANNAADLAEVQLLDNLDDQDANLTRQLGRHGLGLNSTAAQLAVKRRGLARARAIVNTRNKERQRVLSANKQAISNAIRLGRGDRSAIMRGYQDIANHHQTQADNELGYAAGGLTSAADYLGGLWAENGNATDVSATST